jgi:hypothetical protein
MSGHVTATVRMYRLDELGDCFLLTFRAADARTHVLIDCGSFRNGEASRARLRAVVAAIARDLDGDPLHVVVGTHQHNDHLSGFVHCEDAVRALHVGQVWLSWLDDPDDAQARAIGRTFERLRAQIVAARGALRARGGGAPGGATARTLAVMDDVLAFFGNPGAAAAPALPATAVRILRTLGAQPPRYLQPGQTLALPGLPEDAVRIHVLGPPRNQALLYRRDPRSGETYDPHLAAAAALAGRYVQALATGDDAAERDHAHYPFHDQYKRRAPARRRAAGPLAPVLRRYRDPAEAWRTIDDDWLQQGDALALFLDTYTNNSSVALAIELVATGKVLLFPADAQTGNWRSWAEVAWERPGVTTAGLMARTVFYKAGHHASHNATLPALFEQVAGDGLVALIPVHKRDPNIARENGWRMPARHLLERLIEKTQGRVLQMDGVDPPACDPEQAAVKQKWTEAGVALRRTPLAIEVDITG